jgi:hypothetical protein
MIRRRWHTFTLIAAGAAVVACAGDGDQMRSPTEVSPTSSASAYSPTSEIVATARPSGLLGDVLNGVLGTGKGLPLFVCKNNGGPYTGSAVVGLLGGTMHFGPHTLFIPPLAVLQRTSISATTYAGDTLAVTFQPEGLRFIVPATLSLDYGHCAVQPQSPLQIDYLNSLLTELLSIIPSLDKGNGNVTGLINHFSVYAGSETRR